MLNKNALLLSEKTRTVSAACTMFVGEIATLGYGYSGIGTKTGDLSPRNLGNYWTVNRLFCYIYSNPYQWELVADVANKTSVQLKGLVVTKSGKSVRLSVVNGTHLSSGRISEGTSLIGYYDWGKDISLRITAIY
nr:MAG TPA: hypothetical protein [Caudoviricetes sp.]